MWQSTNHVLMVEPVAFYANPETVSDNQFQDMNNLNSDVQDLVLKEFLAMRAELERHGVKVAAYHDIKSNDTPDSIYPNNWFSTHSEGRLCLYPLRAVSRRRERRADIIAELKKKYVEIFDLSKFETLNRFLEGTGSMVLDRINKVAYAALSPRTDADLFGEWCLEMGYRPVAFDSADSKGRPIYHTNVLLTIGTGYAIICAEVISNANERTAVVDSLCASGREILQIRQDQMGDFCANTLELKSGTGKPLLVMSKRAHSKFTVEQLRVLSTYCKEVICAIPNIENFGGGGVRCMLAELF